MERAVQKDFVVVSSTLRARTNLDTVDFARILHLAEDLLATIRFVEARVVDGELFGAGREFYLRMGDQLTVFQKGVTGRPLIGNRLANGRLHQSDAGQVGLLGLDM
jgi:hypothetical protein